MFNKYLHIILAFVCLFSVGTTFGQRGYMTIRGKVVLNEKGLQGVNVILLKNGTKTDEALTGSSGKYTFNELDISPEGDIYIIKIAKPGHISIKHWVSTKAPDKRETIFPDYFPEVELFKKVNEVDKEKALSAILDKPISKFGYSVSKGDFSDDRAYFSTIKAQVNQLFEILDAEDRERKRLLAAYRLKQLAEANKVSIETKVAPIAIGAKKSNFEIKYEKQIAEADDAYEGRKYREAMRKYKAVMALVSKSGLKKRERDKLKKYPKRRIYDLETLTAGLSDEEIDALENETEEEVSETEEVENAITEEGEVGADEEEAVEAELEEEQEEEEEEEEVSEEELAKAEAEKSIPNAMEARDRMIEERREEVIQKRRENAEIAAVKTMSSNAEVKKHEVAMSIAKKETQAKMNKNKDVVAQRNKLMVTMLANTKKSSKPGIKKAIPMENREERPSTINNIIVASAAAADKDKKNLDRSVVIVHNRIKLTSTKRKPTTNKPVGKARILKPKSVRYTEELLYKTVTNTIITFPVRQDTLQQVDYRWGVSYYYMNTKEITETTYNIWMDLLK